jgi:hypothetical protein
MRIGNSVFLFLQDLIRFNMENTVYKSSVFIRRCVWISIYDKRSEE